MHCIEALAAGIVGATNGTVDIYRRDTLVRVPIYTSFEGDGMTTPSASTALGTNGQLVVYVEEVVDVVAKDSGGNTVRSWTSGTNAKSIEVISPSFTGNDYVGGGSGANKPTTLQAVLDAVITSFGGTNWNIAGGSTIASGYGALAGVVYNVKSYGAVGNGVADDSAAITTASAAAQAAGGGVLYFPPGTYRCLSPLVIGTLVTLRGASAAVSKIRFAHADAFLIVGTLMEDLAVDSNTTLNNYFVQNQTSGATLRVVRCIIGSTSGAAAGCICVLGGQAIELIDTAQVLLGATQAGVRGGSSDMLMIGGSVTAAGTTYSGDMVSASGSTHRFAIIGTRFDYSASTAGDANIIALTLNNVAGDYLAVTGCAIRGSTLGGAATFITIDGTSHAKLTESGNQFYGDTFDPSLFVLYDLTVNPLTSRMQLSLRDNYSGTYTVSGASGLTIDTLTYGEVIVEMTDNGAKAVTLGTAYAGLRLTLIWWNNHGAGGGTITLGANVKMEAATNQFTVGANSFRAFEFRGAVINGANYWVQVGEDTVDEPE